MKYDSMSVEQIQSEIDALTNKLQEKVTALAKAMCPYVKGEIVYYQRERYKITSIDYYEDGVWTLNLSRLNISKRGVETISSKTRTMGDSQIPIREEWRDNTK